MKVINRIKKHAEFTTVIENGKFVKTDSLTLYFLENNLNYTRIGISIPKKSGKAVIRNKMKRQIRAILANEFDYKLGFDLVFVARKKYDINNFNQTKLDIIELIGKVG